MPIVICPKCGKIIPLKIYRDTTINCPQCGKAISIHIKMDDKPFKIVCCPRCGNFQVVKARKHFKCRYCGYHSNMEKLTIYGECKNSRDARERIIELKEARNKK
jgi:transposase